MWAVLADAIDLEDARKIAAYQQELSETRTIFPLDVCRADRHDQTLLSTSGINLSHPRLCRSQTKEGVTGIEEYYNGFLIRDGAGLLGQKSIPVSNLAQDVLRFVPSSVGKDLVLTLDSTVQWIIREELIRGLGGI